MRTLFLVCAYLSPCYIWWREGEDSGFFFFKGINPIMGAQPLWPHLTRITPKGPTSKAHHTVCVCVCVCVCVLKLQHMNWGEQTFNPKHLPSPSLLFTSCSHRTLQSQTQKPPSAPLMLLSWRHSLYNKVISPFPFVLNTKLWWTKPATPTPHTRL